MKVTPYEPGAAAEWDGLAARAPMATFLHTRRFLGYHGDRFRDASLTIRDDDGRLLGLMPAAADPTDAQLAVTHPGATFGGIVHDGSLAGAAMLDALAAVGAHLRDGGFTRLRYAAVPSIYHQRPSADDLYALFRHGAERVRCDLSCAVDLEVGPALSSRRRRGLSKARREGVEVVEGAGLVDELWPAVEANLAERHGARPVHSAAEMRMLVDLFPDEIVVVLGRLGGEAVAGVALFESPRVSHAQYIASVGPGMAAGALEAVFAHCLERASQTGKRYFDFGTSNREQGRVLNTGLYRFKSEFGASGVAYEFYDLPITNLPPR
jgi:hypothetical protein